MIAASMNSLKETKFLLGRDIPFGLQAAPYGTGIFKRKTKMGK